MTRRNQKHGLNFETLYRGWKKHRFSNLEKVWVHRKIIITFTFSRDNIGSIGCIEGTREMNCNGLMRLRTLDPWFPFNPGPTLSFIFSFSSYTYTFILLPVHSYIGYKIQDRKYRILFWEYRIQVSGPKISNWHSFLYIYSSNTFSLKSSKCTRSNWKPKGMEALTQTLIFWSLYLCDPMSKTLDIPRYS